MKRNIICNRIFALLLTAVLCTSFCTGFAVNAEEVNEGLGEQTELSEDGKIQDSQVEEPAEQGTAKVEEQEEWKKSKESETYKTGSLPERTEEQGQQEFSENPEEEQSVEQKQSEEQERKESNKVAAVDLHNPQIVKDSNMKAGQKVTYDCVWFGSYPQAEIVSSTVKYIMVDNDLLEDGDIIVDNSLYNILQNASGWNSNNDITINGVRYRRMKKEDATHLTFSTSDYETFYTWPDSNTYHYFKYEPIKWRVLDIDGEQALLVSDVTLDDQRYNVDPGEITWGTSTIRSWLNGYDISFNDEEMDYSEKNFVDSAFTSEEQSAIVNTVVVNANNIKYGTEGGDNTIDKLFFLSEEEMYGNSALSYGFLSGDKIEDEARRCKSSTYAKAMGVYIDTSDFYKSNCDWWLRSPGVNSDFAASVYYDGRIENHGCSAYNSPDGVRPALTLNLTSNQWSYAGTVSSDEKEDNNSNGDSGGNGTNDGNGDTENTGENNNNGTNGNNESTDVPTKEESIKVSKITLSGISQKIAAGKKIKLTAKITPSNATNKAITWKSSDKKVATVNSKGIVTLKKNSGGKKVTITATAKDGSKKKATYKITSMKGVVKRIAISGKKTRTVKAGKNVLLKAKVTVSNSKQANKKLKWTSSNTKYATVSSNGKIKTKKAGKRKTVTITAMATDGSNKKASVKVKIK